MINKKIKVSKTPKAGAKAPVTFTKWNMLDHLDTPARQERYLAFVFAEGDELDLALFMGELARAKGTVQFAKDCGLSRETIQKQFRKGGNPTFKTMQKALSVLGYQLTIKKAA